MFVCNVDVSVYCPWVVLHVAPIANGMRQYTLGTMPVYGAILSYECDSGYELNGPASIICTESGWSDAEPTCEILECPFDYFRSLVSKLHHKILHFVSVTGMKKSAEQSDVR